MQEVVWQENNQIEIQFWNHLTRDEFKEAVHQLESLAAQHPKINVMIDAVGMDGFDAGVVIDDYGFYQKYKDRLDRVAVISDSKFQSFLVEQFDKFSDVEIRTYTNDQIDEARKWIFPSRLPG